MKVKSKNGETLNFLRSGNIDIYILDRVALEAAFDEDNNNDWEKSTGKKKLQEWAEENLPKEILERFDVDLPAAEEVFSQKTLNLDKSSRKLKSKQLPIFQNSDNRMMELDGEPKGWWTKTTCADYGITAWIVFPDGGMGYFCACTPYWFVPVLRRKKKRNRLRR